MAATWFQAHFYDVTTSHVRLQAVITAWSTIATKHISQTK